MADRRTVSRAGARASAERNRRWVVGLAAVTVLALPLPSIVGTVQIAHAEGLISTGRAYTYPYQDPSHDVADRVTDLMSRMSVEDKVGQMAQAERGTQSDRERGGSA